MSDIQTSKEITMSVSETGRIGKRGTYVIPADFRKHFALHEGSEVIAEKTPQGILIRPAMTVPLETYSVERKAEFLLSNAVDAEDFERAADEVRNLGLDPETVEHSYREGR